MRAQKESIKDSVLRIKPNWAVARMLHLAASQFINVDTHFDNSNNYSAHRAIYEHLNSDKQILIVHNRQNNSIDPLVISSIMQREKVFHPMRTKTSVPVSPNLFNSSRYGWLARSGGAVPKLNGIDSATSYINHGMHAVIYPEDGSYLKSENETENQESTRDLSKISLPFASAIGNLVCGLNNPDNVRFVCVATVYGSDNQDYRHPTSLVQYPIPVASTPELVVADTEDTLQWTLEKAIALVNG